MRLFHIASFFRDIESENYSCFKPYIYMLSICRVFWALFLVVELAPGFIL